MSDRLIVILDDLAAGTVTRLRGGRLPDKLLELVADRAARCRKLLARLTTPGRRPAG